MTPRRDVLRGVVQWLGPLIVRGVRPICGEDVVGLASENEVERRAHRLTHDLSHLLVPIVHRPPPCAKPPLSSSPGPPGACMTPSRVKKVLTISFLISRVLSIESPARAKPNPSI